MNRRASPKKAARLLAPEHFALRDGVSFCECADRLIFLDVERDRYFALSSAAEFAFRQVYRERELDGASQMAVEQLAKSGVLAPAAKYTKLQPCPAPPVARTSLTPNKDQFSSGALVHAMARLALSSAESKLMPLRSRIAQLRRRKSAITPSYTESRGTLAQIASVFRFSGLVITPHDRCLPRSIALAHTLLDRRIAPTFVFGVRLQPFGAHCWVQVGDCLLNESIDEVRNFTPILVV